MREEPSKVWYPIERLQHRRDICITLLIISIQAVLNSCTTASQFSGRWSSLTSILLYVNDGSAEISIKCGYGGAIIVQFHQILVIYQVKLSDRYTCRPSHNALLRSELKTFQRSDFYDCRLETSGTQTHIPGRTFAQIRGDHDSDLQKKVFFSSA